MPREYILDDKGEPMLDDNGKPIIIKVGKRLEEDVVACVHFCNHDEMLKFGFIKQVSMNILSYAYPVDSGIDQWYSPRR